MQAHLFEIHFSVVDKIILPVFNKGNILRGALGRSLRDMVCLFPQEECVKCGVVECVYRDFFNSMPNPDVKKLSKNESIPRPYVIKPPLEKKELYKKDEIIKFDIVIFGKAVQFLPYILIMLKNAADRGLGKNRGKACLKRIYQKNPVTGGSHELFSSENNMVYPEDICFTESDFDIPETDRITLNFITPAIIKDCGKFVHTPSFEALIKKIRDRFSALSWFYQGEEPDIDFKNFAEKARNVKTVRANTTFMKSQRKTRDKTGMNISQNMSGFVGSLIYEGTINEYMPYLLFGQYMHVGKAAVLGNGWYNVEI